jgi:hypothetical protein
LAQSGTRAKDSGARIERELEAALAELATFAQTRTTFVAAQIHQLR